MTDENRVNDDPHKDPVPEKKEPILLNWLIMIVMMGGITLAGVWLFM